MVGEQEAAELASKLVACEEFWAVGYRSFKTEKVDKAARKIVKLLLDEGLDPAELVLSLHSALRIALTASIMASPELEKAAKRVVAREGS